MEYWAIYSLATLRLSGPSWYQVVLERLETILLLDFLLFPFTVNSRSGLTTSLCGVPQSLPLEDVVLVEFGKLHVAMVVVLP